MEGLQKSTNLNSQQTYQDIQNDYKQILKTNPSLDEIVKLNKI